MSMQWVRDNYSVPAKRGARVEYTGGIPSRVRMGTIVSSVGPHLRIRLDGEKFAGTYHPTWCLKYLEAKP